MIRFQVLHGVELSGAASLPTVTRTDEGRAMGAVPGWAMLLDPDYANPAAGTLLNRARGVPSGLYSGEIDLGTFPDSNETAIARPTEPFAVYGSAAIQPDAFSMFAVVHLLGSSDLGQIVTFGYGNGNHTGDEVAPNWGYLPNAGLLTIRQNASGTNNSAGQSTARLSASVGDIFGETHLLMMSFSTRDGLRLFMDGELLASEPDDVRPLTHDFGAGEWTMYRNGRGYYGMAGLLNIDLGWPEHAGYRRAIERFLMDKYGIT